MNSLILLLFLVILFLFVLLVIQYFKIKRQKLNFANNLKLILNTVNSVRYGNLDARLMLDNEGNLSNLATSINRMVETIQDREKMIQEFKKEITGQNFFLETLINSLSEGFLILDDNFVIKKMTSESLNILGKEAEGKKVDEFFKFDFELKDVVALKTIEIFLKNNSEKIYLATFSMLNLAENADFKYLMTIKDISKEKELQGMRNNIIATLAHDLRVPLIAECNTLKLLKDNKFGSYEQKIDKVLDLLIKSNNDVLSLTEILLDTCKMEQIGLSLNKSEVNVNLLIKEVCDELLGILMDSSMQIEFNFADDFILNLDVLQIKRVLKNIITNSVEYSSQFADKIKISTSFDNKGCEIIVTDYGQGISDEEKELVFQKFYSGAHKFRKVGSGLGLYLSNEIVKAHGGKISISSEKDKQTDFIIFLPKL